MRLMQKAYEKIRAHLIEQGKPAMNPMTGGCFYRAEGGLKCAVGCLISDDAYEPSLEDCTPLMDNVTYALKQSGWDFTLGELQFLRAMQEQHDAWRGMTGLNDVIYGIDQLAKRYKLEVVK